jgi:hypothetical protein
MDPPPRKGLDTRLFNLLDTPGSIPNYKWYPYKYFADFGLDDQGNLDMDRCLQSLYPSYEVHLEALRAVLVTNPTIYKQSRRREESTIIASIAYDLNYSHYNMNNHPIHKLASGKITLKEYVERDMSWRYSLGEKKMHRHLDGTRFDEWMYKALQLIYNSIVTITTGAWLGHSPMIEVIGKFSRGSYTVNPANAEVFKTVSAVYEQYGFVWSEEHFFINPNHPMYLAYIGEIDLTPEVFELCVGSWSIEDGTRIISAMSISPYNRDEIDRRDYKNLSQGMRSLGMSITKVGWKKDQLIAAIEEGATKVGRLLTLDLLTGNMDHQMLLLPGFGSDASVSTASITYYQLVYRVLFNTLQYSDMSNLCSMGLPLAPLKLMAKQGFGIVVGDDVEAQALCEMIMNESNRRLLIRNGITSNIDTEEVSALILQPGSVWVMDAVGTTHLFKDTRGLLTQYPDSILPQTLSELAARYQEICRNKDTHSEGEFIRIVEMLGGRLMLPANLKEINKTQLCSIIEMLLTEKLSERDRYLIGNRLPASYSLYREMCENKEKYPLNTLIAAAEELGLDNSVKRSTCVWLHGIGGLTSREQQHINMICDHKDQYSLTTFINSATHYDRKSSQLRDILCGVITRWLNTTLLSHLHIPTL